MMRVTERIKCQNDREWDILQLILFKLGFKWCGNYPKERKRYCTCNVISMWNNKRLSYGKERGVEITFEQFIIKMENEQTI